MSTADFEVFSRLSGNLRVSARMASEIAKSLFSPDVKPVHIFLGIILNEDSLGSKALQAMGVEVNEVLKNFAGGKQFTFSRQSLQDAVDLKLSKSSQEVFRSAFAISKRYSHVYVGTEHILFAILEDKTLQLTKDLASAGLNIKFFRENLMNFATYPVGILAKPDLDNDKQVSDTALSVLGKDLVVEAKEGRLDPLVGREEELQQVINILSRRRKNNPVIVGDPGVGKTALVEGLAQLIAAGTVPNSLLNTRLISLDVSAILAGSKLRGDVEEKVIAIINEVIDSPNIILFIDEIHNIFGTSFPGGGLDIAAVLKPALLRDEFRVIGATTTAEYTRFFEEDNALVRRFQPIILTEPSVDETLEILHRVEPLLEQHHNVNITPEALLASVKLSDRYVSDRFLPDKAIDLLDEAAASRRLELEVKYKDVADVMAQHSQAINRKEMLVSKGDLKAAKLWQEKEEKLNEKLQEIEKKRSRSKNASSYKVDVEAIQKVVSKWTGIPVTTIDDQETNLLKNLETFLGDKVIGQSEAVESVASAIKRARTGISDVGRPWASLLFLGPTGVGKTELAKVLTQLLFGDEKRLIQIDMSEMMEMHSVSKLIGSPPGYVGYREGGQLTEKIRKNPHSVILFDEIEKAHVDVLNILLQIMEYGHLTDGKGNRVNFKNTVIIMTSNIGAEEIQKDKILGFGASPSSNQKSDEEIESAYEAMKSELERKLKGTLRPELLNRLDDIVIFRSLTRKDAKKIVALLVDELNERLKDNDLKVSLSTKVINYIVSEGFSEEYGARNLRRVIQDNVENVVADYMLSVAGKKKAKRNAPLKVKLDLVGDEIKIV